MVSSGHTIPYGRFGQFWVQFCHTVVSTIKDVGPQLVSPCKTYG